MANYFFRFEPQTMQSRFQAIRLAASSGAVGASEIEYTAWLMETAGSLLTGPLRPPRPPSSHLPDVHHRALAATLLAYMGSRETISFLIYLFVNDPSPVVQAAAAETIGRIGADPGGLAIRAFTNAVLPPVPLRNETVLIAIAAATGALCRFSGPPLSGIGIPLLTFLANHYDIPRAQAQARFEIRSLTM